MIRPAELFRALQHATEETLDKDGNTVYVSGLVDLKAMAAYLNGEDDEEEPEPEHEDYDEPEEDED